MMNEATWTILYYLGISLFFIINSLFLVDLFLIKREIKQRTIIAFLCLLGIYIIVGFTSNWISTIIMGLIRKILLESSYYSLLEFGILLVTKVIFWLMQSHHYKKDSIQKKTNIQSLALILILILFIPTTITKLSQRDWVYQAKSLPDILVNSEGKEITTISEWNDSREEIKAILQEYEYGTIPERPEAINVKLISTALGYENLMIHDLYNITLYPEVINPERNLSFLMDVYRPLTNGTYPLLLSLCGPLVGEKNAREYVFVDIDQNQFDPDTEGYDIIGPAQQLYPEYTWGALATWAWGASRALDIAINFPQVNSSQVGIIGHSRCAKAALVAAAFDERFTFVIASGSGCGGAAAYTIRTPNAQDLAQMTQEKYHKSWFASNLSMFANREEQLPFDQHFLLGLIAPRHILLHEAPDDDWANPLGTYMAFQGAKTVYNLYQSHDNIRVHAQLGGHDRLLENKTIFFNFIDEICFNTQSDTYFSITGKELLTEYPNILNSIENPSFFGYIRI